MPDVHLDQVPDGVRWKVGDRVHACFPNEDATSVVNGATGKPFEALGTVIGLPDGAFEPGTLLITYDGYPPGLPRAAKMFCHGEMYVPAELVRKVNPAEHAPFDAAVAARGDAMDRPPEVPQHFLDSNPPQCPIN